MSKTEVIKELQKIIDGNTCSWNQMSIMEQAIKLLSPTPSKELKSVEQIITEQIGIRLDAPKQTPMDKGECIVCMEAYASQLHPSPTPAVTEAVEFAEWVMKNTKQSLDENYVIYNRENFWTIPQLYSLFKNQKQ